MIVEHYNSSGTSVHLSQKELIIWRYHPFGFSLIGMKGKIVAPPIVLISNDNYSETGSIESIEYIKAKALGEEETWTPQQLYAVASTKTIYIIYNSFENIYLRRSNETLTMGDLKEQNPNAEVFLTHEVSDTGLVNLVDELLNWMKAWVE